MRRPIVVWIIVAVPLMVMMGNSRAELYTSVDELSHRLLSRNRIIELMDEKLEAYTERIEKLKQLRKILGNTLELDTNATRKPADHLNKSQPVVSNPIGAFIALSRLANDLIEAKYLIEDDDTANGLASDFEKLLEEANLPSADDAIGSGEALLRLQKFYNLSAKDLAEGRILFNNLRIDGDDDNDRGMIEMNFDDSFLLGKIATDDEQYKLALEWFDIALSRAKQEGFDESTDVEAEKYNYLLEYMAYAAYKDSRLEYASELTQMWIKRDPENSKALDNLEYYTWHTRSPVAEEGDNQSTSDAEEFLVPLENEPKNETSLQEELLDKISHLCRNTRPSSSNRNKCLMGATGHWSQVLGWRIEVLHDSPRIIRVYDVLAPREAQELRREALPILKRSTVGDGASFKASQTRIAKTAWLPDSIVGGSSARKLKDRLKALMNIDFSTAEMLQVVNYGLGGFYDVHLDAFSFAQNSPELSDTDRASMEARIDNNRLATVLIYLDDVKAGGSTIFPQLNLNVEPIKGSAVIWFNLHKNRTIDTRTAHMGCPVLLGSKWIATIWPREMGNTFLHPCSLNKDE